jgi:hypothetical protein
MKKVFNRDNACEAEKYVGKKVLCFYQTNDIEGSPIRIGVLEQINTGNHLSPFIVDINTHKILANFEVIAYDKDLDTSVKDINEFIHESHCDHKIDAKDFSFIYCPVCGLKLE